MVNTMNQNRTFTPQRHTDTRQANPMGKGLVRGEQRSDIRGGEPRCGGAGAGGEGVEKRCFPFLQLENLFLDGACGDHAVDHDVVVLADAVGAIDCLVFSSRVPPGVKQEDIISFSEGETEASGLEGDEEHRGAVLPESPDGLRAVPGGAVKIGKADSSLLETLRDPM